MKWNRDCKSFQGVYACDILKTENYKDCSECKFYEPYSKKILILKIGAIGDVIRTTPILNGLRKKYGEDIHITWVIGKESYDLIKNNEYVDKTLLYNEETILRLKKEKFDILLSLEIAPPATLLANEINSNEKFGYFFDEDSHPSVFNKKAEPYLDRVFSDKIDKETKKTYQEMLFEIIELDYNKEEYVIPLTKQEYAQKFKRDKKLGDKIIGINVGSGSRWPSKRWDIEKLKELIKKIKQERDYDILLLGGPEEEEVLRSLSKELGVVENYPSNTILEYISIVNLCDLIITGDTITMHLGIGLNKKIIALFFCTPPWQIEDYGRVKKLTSSLLDKHYFDNQYHEDLVNSISVEEVFNQIE
ncbi:MAG: glycosyltransferase family 9 protein [Candidatus Nanoarchaeia archaeon]|nr:glycosyltransferase family 9 protein [Candidatus Nanoarchaeia archaeon]